MIVINGKPNVMMLIIYKIINRIFYIVDRLRWTSHYMAIVNDFQHIGKNVVIDYGVSFSEPRNISIEDDVFIGREVVLNAGKGGKIKLGKNCALGAGSTLITWNLDLMSNRNLNRACNRNIFKDIEIGAGAGLGYSCTVNPGVTLGSGCEVAAGSVILSDVHDFEIAGGAPAIVIGKRCDAP